jgi:hypothetical protein
MVLGFFLLLVTPLFAQNILRIRIVEGEGVAYPLGSRATRGITVQVTDETGKPVPEAVVTFRLPDSGPTGTFTSGGRTEIAITAADGRALAWGMQWNREAGAFEVRITASKGEARAGAVCALYLTEAAVSSREAPVDGAMRRHKKLWVALAAVGGAVAAVSLSSGSSASSAPPASVNGPRIGAPTIIIGRP